MKKIIITILCVCITLASHAIKTKTLNGRARAFSLHNRIGFHQGVVSHGHLRDMMQKAARRAEYQKTLQNLPTRVQRDFAKEILTTTLPARTLLNTTQRSLPRLSYRNPSSTGPFGRETVFAQGMQLAQDLSRDLEQFTGESSSFKPTLGNLTRYNELAAQMQKLINEEAQLYRDYQHMTAYEKAKPIRNAREKLAQEITQELQKQTGYKDLSVERGYVPSQEILAKLNGVVQRIQEQQKSVEANKPSPLSTLSEADRTVYARNRALEIIHFQERLRHYIVQMDKSWAEHMLQLDSVLSWYKYYYSTLAGVPIPVWHNYLESVLPQKGDITEHKNISISGIYGFFKSNWATIEVRGLEEAFSVAQPQPDFKGLSGKYSATLATDILARTKGQTAEAADAFASRTPMFARWLKEYPQELAELEKKVLPLIERVRKNLIWFSERESSLSPSLAKVRLEKIIEAQTELRTFAVKHVFEEGEGRILINLDTTLSWYRYFYATSAGLFSDIPISYLIQLSQFENRRPYGIFTNTIEKWKTWHELKRPMVPQEEVANFSSQKTAYVSANRSSGVISRNAIEAKKVLDKTKYTWPQLVLTDKAGNFLAKSNFLDRYMEIYMSSSRLIDEMRNELESITGQEKHLSNEEMTRRLENIVATQANLRAFVGEHLWADQPQANELIEMDTVLCWFRNFYAKRLGYRFQQPREYELSSEENLRLHIEWQENRKTNTRLIPHKEIGLPKHFDQFMQVAEDPLPRGGKWYW